MPRTSKTPTRLRTALIAVVAVAGLVGSGLAYNGIAHADHDEHIEIPSGDGEQFVWPMSSWISANDHYATGTPHGASADLAVQLGTPIHPARPGEVVSVSYSQRGGWMVRIVHEADNGEVYYSGYGHLADEPLVEEEQHVDLDTPLGYNGRLGNAGVPHIHFTLSLLNDDGERDPIKIPGLEIGDWVHAGEHIAGVFEGLDPIEAPSQPLDVEVVDDFLRVYETLDRKPDEVVAELSEGDEISVLESHRGQYRVDVDGELGWIPHSGVRPVEAAMYGVEVTSASRVNVRSSPDSTGDANIIGVAEGHAILTGYESDDGWHRVLWPCNSDTNRSDDSSDVDEPVGGCPGLDPDAERQKYGWIGPSVSQTSSQFETRGRLLGMGLYANKVEDGEDQPDPDRQVDEVTNTYQNYVVLETRNGWYRVDADGQDAWMRGWHTGGPR